MINSAKQNKTKEKRREVKKGQGKELERSWLAYAAGTDPKTT